MQVRCQRADATNLSSRLLPTVACNQPRYHITPTQESAQLSVAYVHTGGCAGLPQTPGWLQPTPSWLVAPELARPPGTLVLMPPTPPPLPNAPSSPEGWLSAIRSANDEAVSRYKNQNQRQLQLRGTAPDEEIEAAAAVAAAKKALAAARTRYAEVRAARSSSADNVRRRVTEEVEEVQLRRLRLVLAALSSGFPELTRRGIATGLELASNWTTKIVRTGYQRWPEEFDAYPGLVPSGSSSFDPARFRDPELTSERSNVAAVASPVEPPPATPPTPAEPDTDLLAEEF